MIFENKSHPPPRMLVGVVGRGWLGLFQAEAGDFAAGELVGGEGRFVFVGDVEEAVETGGVSKPSGEGFHFGTNYGGYASEVDVDDYEGHVGIPRWPSECSQRWNWMVRDSPK